MLGANLDDVVDASCGGSDLGTGIGNVKMIRCVRCNRYGYRQGGYLRSKRVMQIYIP